MLTHRASSMILEFTQAFGSWGVGDITDTVSEGTGRALIAEGKAKESTEGAQLRSLIAAESKRSREETLELVRSSLQGDKTKTAGPPNGGGGVDFQTISATSEIPAEEKKNRCFTDVIRCIHAVSARETPPEIREWASMRLRTIYADEEIQYKVNKDTGKIDSHVTRNLPGGGKETVIRTGTDSLGGGATYGYSIKPNYLGDLFRIARESEVFASSARAIPMPNGIETKYPALGQYSAPTISNGNLINSAVFGGITLAYVGETTARPESDAIMEEIEFKAVDMVGATSFSRDYIGDNFIAMDSVVTGMFGDAMAWMEDWMTINGPGNGVPQGWFNSSATIQGGAASGNATRVTANKIASEDLGWMLSHLAPCPNPRFIAHRSTIPQLFILNNAAGTPVFQPNASIVQSDPLSIMSKSNNGAQVYSTGGMLLGLPIFFTEKVPQLGSTGDISLVCPNQYGLAEREGFEVGMSEHFYFSTDKVAYRFKKRHDGRSLWRKPYIDTSGGVTSPSSGWLMSPWIMLAHL